MCFLQVAFCKVLVFFFVANVDELESYIAQRETTLCQIQNCLAMETFEKKEAFMAAVKACN